MVSKRRLEKIEKLLNVNNNYDRPDVIVKKGDKFFLSDKEFTKEELKAYQADKKNYKNLPDVILYKKGDVN